MDEIEEKSIKLHSEINIRANVRAVIRSLESENGLFPNFTFIFQRN